MRGNDGYRVMRSGRQTLMFYIGGPLGFLGSAIVALAVLTTVIALGIVTVPGINTVNGVTLKVGASAPVHPTVPDGYTVKRLLDYEGLSLGNHDAVTPNMDTPVSDGMTIVITRRSTTTVTETSTIAPPEDSYINDDSLAPGDRKVVRPASPGSVEKTYREKLVNGRIDSRKLLAKVITGEPMGAVIHLGPGVTPGNTTHSFTLTCESSTAISVTVSGTKDSESGLAISFDGHAIGHWKGHDNVTGDSSIPSAGDVTVTWSGNHYEWKAIGGVCHE